MGCYDTVELECPACEEPYEAQSKSGPCGLDYFLLAECPADVMMDVNRHAPFTCAECGAKFEVEFKIPRQ